MKKLSIPAMSEYLSKLIDHNIKSSLMIWGPPGIGKSALVSAVAKNHSIDLIDLRISQLAPTDLRGLPVPEDNKAKWYVPEFLPTTGKGILFLDEINMAPPAIQGIAQQLILDRKVADNRVYPSMDILKSGTRKEELLVSKADLQKTFVLRRILNPMGTTDAIEFLIGKLKQTKNNAEFFDSMNT